MIKRAWNGIKLMVSVTALSIIGVVGFYLVTRSYSNEKDKFKWIKVDGEWRVTKK